ncbi:MAG: hypothetical protein WKF79_13310 [Nocardioides sp.]
MNLVETALAAAVATPFALGLAASGPDRPRPEFEFRDPQIVESSGLVARDGLFVTVNDSGDTGRIFVVDPASGRTVGSAAWDAEATDVEALAPTDDGTVLVGDIGDNAGSRDSVRILEVPMTRGDRSVEPPLSELTYAGGPTDAEALLVHPGSGQLLIASKGLFGGVLYAAPAGFEMGAGPDRPTRLEAIGDVIGLVTDGAFFPDGRHFVLRDYGRAVVYSYPALSAVGSFTLPDQPQGEGIAVDEDGSVFVSTEGQFTSVLRVPLPLRIARVVDPAPSPTTDPGPDVESLPDEGDQPLTEPATEPDRPAWPWLLGGAVGAAALAVLLRALRPR